MHAAVASVQDALASKRGLGIMVMLVNVGSRFVFADVRPAVERALRNPWTKRAVVFASIFLTTRDVVVATACLFLFMLLVEGLAGGAGAREIEGAAPPQREVPAELEAIYESGRQLARPASDLYYGIRQNVTSK